ncbi:MAG: alpha/beta fold hydrolase [Deltaproteobacteria bacterium]|nr:alpha/beta fold hydrolase [Deltaproteobacteria bacterium]
MFSEFKGFPICEKIACPTLIVAGQYDHLTPKSYMEKLHQLIKTSELFIVPQGSHVSQWDMPEVVNLRIEKFLSNI